MSEIKPTKKQVEEHYLQQFARLMGSQFPSGQIEPDEEPDFLVGSENSVTGIELTELHCAAPRSGRPLQATEAMRHRVVAKASELYKASAAPAVLASVFFNDHHEIQKSTVEPLAQTICELIRNNVPGQNGRYEEQYDWINRQYFPEEVHAVCVNRLPQITETFFNAPSATWVGTLTASDIQGTLSAKELKHRAYMKKCNETWLVINADFGAMSSWFEFDESLPDQVFTSSFQRVFLMRHFAQQIHELKLQKPG